ncbi:cation-translocating P-type ATPase [Amphritea sp. HPY]|uniref:cation-translocating P-type ATPase n=1 Tax=Amphritea sp. HPY TaxID=3421652 RepID=UPI003D7E7440
MPGLSQTQAEILLAKHGANLLPQPSEDGLILIFLRQFKNPFIYVLLAAALVSWFLNHYINSYFIFAVLLLNAMIGSLQEHSAARAAKALKKMVPSYSTVIRDNRLQQIPNEQLVPSDLVELVSGDKVPADIRLTESQQLSCDESMLTGESLPQSKQSTHPIPDSAALIERTDMLFAGTIVTRGRGRGIVAHTGSNTQIGQIASEIGGTANTMPPLLQRMQRFTLKVTYSVLLVIALLFLITLLRGDDLSQVFLMGVALAVSAIPEGLPAAITIALAIGMRRMARVGVIVRKLLAVEALGSCTLVASDKTGTLTLNEMTIHQLILPTGRQFNVSGEGKDLHGAVETNNQIEEQELQQLATAGALANQAELKHVDGQWLSHGDHVDIAFLVLAIKLGVDIEQLKNRYRQLDMIPYESENAYSASINLIGKQTMLLAKGSVERILDMCSHANQHQVLERQLIIEQEKSLAQQGHRVMALASRPLPESYGSPEDELHDLDFLGIVGMLDPLRPEVPEAIAACKKASINVLLVTGDHPDTATSIANQLNLSTRLSGAITGRELEQRLQKATPEQWTITAQERVFARVEPKQKQLLVEQLIRQGEFVAVTGDGVNDAPALRHAHVGIAMGKRGTDVARESADLILTDDNFASIIEGIRQGRLVYSNIRKVVFLLISTGAAEIFLFILSVLFGLPLPLLPIQLLWLNLVTNGMQDIALAFEPAEGNELNKPPRSPQEPMFNRLMIERVLINALVMGGIAFVLFVQALQLGMNEVEARNLTLLLMVLFENIHVFNSRSETLSIFKHPFFSNPFLLIGMLCAQGIHIAAMHLPIISDILQITPVTLQQWASLLSYACILILIDVIHKWWRINRGV